MLSQKTAALLRALADKYERDSFMQADPSRFLRVYSEPREQELLSFVVSQLAFGQREQFLGKLDGMLGCVGTEPFSEWLLKGGYKNFFPKSQKKFYRFFSYADMNALCGRLAEIVGQYGSLGQAVREAYEGGGSDGGASSGLAKLCGISDNLRLVAALISLFPGQKCVSQNPKGACKKLHMFLRWMVRRGSPVDLGLWDWASPADLLIPLDTHVLQESARLGLIAPNAAASAKTAIELTQKMAQVFPGDPARADYALFGLGVDHE